jgi:L-glutamine-phosphate cytidylyltransferase
LKAIILAAGRGSRLKYLTEDLPKGLVKLAGKSLLEWQVSSLKAVGVDDITIVTGYCKEAIEALGFKTCHNRDWASTNMVSSLLCAVDLITEKTIVSYSDIVYSPDVPRTLLECNEALGVVYDLDWLELWSARSDDPLDDAESFRIGKDGRILEIGKKVSDINEIKGQYTGLMQFTPEATGWINTFLENSRTDPSKLDMTSLLNHLITAGHALQGVGIHGNWCEIDTPNDLEVAQNLLRDKRLDLPDYREEVDS